MIGESGAGLGPADGRFVCVGSYTSEPGGRGEGVTVFGRRALDGALVRRSSLPLASPSFLAVHPRLPVVYAVSEVAQGVVTALGLDAAGQLRPLSQADSCGRSPCHCAVTPDGRHLLCVNYEGGTVAVLPLDGRGMVGPASHVVHREGRGPDPDRQRGPHPHMAVPSADGSVLVVDLGSDEVGRYSLTDTGRLVLQGNTALPPGTGPRQVAIREARENGWGWVVLGELGSSVSLQTVDAESGTERRDVVAATGAAPAGVRNYPAHMVIGRSGQIYVSNRGADSIARFAVTAAGLRGIQEVQVGRCPRHFSLVGRHAYVAAQESDTIEVLDIDEGTGELGNRRVVATVGSPACVVPVDVDVGSGT